MPVMGVVALALGVLVLGLFGALYGGSSTEPDRADAWEAKAAGGLMAVVVGGPVWLAQLVLTLVATIHSDATNWLWLWWVLAPVLGATLGRPVGRLLSRR